MHDRGCFEPVLGFIQKYGSFAVFTHLTPDGDALGSSYSLCALLRSMGKSAFTVLLEPPPWKYAFSEFDDLYCVLPDVDMENVEACIAVDCAARKRLSKAADLFDSLPTLSIDHHVSNDRFAEVNYVEEAPATAELIFDLFEVSGTEVTQTAAAAIYMGIIADTGNLSYPSTTARTFRICADLAADGLDTSSIAERVFNTRTLAATKLIGSFIRNMHLYADGAVAISHLSMSAVRSMHANASDTEALINYARDIDTVEVAAFLREISRETYKVSLRSKGAVNVAEFADQFGGGGHPRAAGCVMHGRWQDLENSLAEKLQGALE